MQPIAAEFPECDAKEEDREKWEVGRGMRWDIFRAIRGRKDYLGTDCTVDLKAKGDKGGRSIECYRYLLLLHGVAGRATISLGCSPLTDSAKFLLRQAKIQFL